MVQQLTGEDLKLAQSRIDATEPGEYEVKDIVGEKWDMIANPTDWGRRFKQSVEAGDLTGIQNVGRNVQNHQIYRVASPKS